MYQSGKINSEHVPLICRMHCVVIALHAHEMSRSFYLSDIVGLVSFFLFLPRQKKPVGADDSFFIISPKSIHFLFVIFKQNFFG